MGKNAQISDCRPGRKRGEPVVPGFDHRKNDEFARTDDFVCYIVAFGGWMGMRNNYFRAVARASLVALLCTGLAACAALTKKDDQPAVTQTDSKAVTDRSEVRRLGK